MPPLSTTDAPPAGELGGLRHIRGWVANPDGLLGLARGQFAYATGEDRATGYLPIGGWPAALAADLADLFGVRFTVLVFQAYRNGSGCDWHADTPFDAQAVVSLGATRTFGVRPTCNGVPGEPAWIPAAHGDVVYMPPGFQWDWEHCVPVEDVADERVSLVFRTVAT